MSKHNSVETVLISHLVKKPVTLSPSPVFNPAFFLWRGQIRHDTRNLPALAKSFDQVLLCVSFRPQAMIDMENGKLPPVSVGEHH
jgi:hypothetical protein